MVKEQAGKVGCTQPPDSPVVRVDEHHLRALLLLTALGYGFWYPLRADVQKQIQVRLTQQQAETKEGRTRREDRRAEEAGGRGQDRAKRKRASKSERAADRKKVWQPGSGSERNARA